MNKNAKMEDILKLLKKSDEVEINLNSGAVKTGQIVTIGDNFIHMELGEGRNSFDSYIQISDIAALDVQVRNLE
jgi:ribosomal protein S1